MKETDFFSVLANSGEQMLALLARTDFVLSKQYIYTMKTTNYTRHSSEWYSIVTHLSQFWLAMASALVLISFTALEKNSDIIPYVFPQYPMIILIVDIIYQ